jgi:excisionase family DNA binding protein
MMSATQDHSPGEPPLERHVSPSWLAHHWQVHIDTIYRDIRKGALPAFRLPGGQLRIKWSDAKKYGRPIE